MTEDADKVVRLPSTAAPRAVPPLGREEGAPYRLFYCIGVVDDPSGLWAAEDLGPQQWRFWEPDPDDGSPDAVAEFLIAPNTPLPEALAALDRIRSALIAEYSPDPKSAA